MRKCAYKTGIFEKIEAKLYYNIVLRAKNLRDLAGNPPTNRIVIVRDADRRGVDVNQLFHDLNVNLLHVHFLAKLWRELCPLQELLIYSLSHVDGGRDYAVRCEAQRSRGAVPSYNIDGWESFAWLTQITDCDRGAYNSPDHTKSSATVARKRSFTSLKFTNSQHRNPPKFVRVRCNAFNPLLIALNGQKAHT